MKKLKVVSLGGIATRIESSDGRFIGRFNHGILLTQEHVVELLHKAYEHGILDGARELANRVMEDTI